MSLKRESSSARHFHALRNVSGQPVSWPFLRDRRVDAYSAILKHWMD